MSASTIARWNAIPLDRSDVSTPSKRKLDEDSDDDVSIVSRSPSPSQEAMEDVQDSVTKYDEYIRGPAREVITVETPIKSSNKGFAMLAKLGWVEGQPLGISGQGRVDPIPFQMKADSTGLGKVRQDVEMIETTVSQRRELDSERQQKETEDQRRAREDTVARKSALAEEISDRLKAFYCTLCDKQFQNVAQYDEHTNSYAHHHKARFKDMQASARIKPQEEIDKRKEKERKREEKELRKIAAASGVRMAKTTLPPPGAPILAPVVSSTVADHSDSKSPGWAPVPGTSTATSSSGFKKSGWASIGSSSSPTPEVPAPVSDSATISSSGFTKSGWARVAGSSNAPVAQPPPPAGTSSGGWKAVGSSSLSVESSAASSQTSSDTSMIIDVPHPGPMASPPPAPVTHHPPSKSHLSRVGWQQFQKKNSKKF